MGLEEREVEAKAAHFLWPPAQEVGGGRGPGFRRAAPRCSA